MIENLPLYRRFGQTELPGRSTLVYVADPKHTHMFESIIRGGPWYVGQLNLPGEGNHYDDFGLLEGWKDRIALLEKDDDADEEVELIGTLLQIVDYCRVNDGRMVLLVQGLERFVVERPRQTKPYPVADVRCLPDVEDLDIAIASCRSRTQARAGALQEALLETKCTLRLFNASGGDVAVEDLIGLDLERLMPLAPFDKLTTKELNDIDTAVEVEEDNEKDESFSVEMELTHYGILREFPSFTKAHDSNSLPSSDELEQFLWSRMEDYVRIRNLDYGDLPRELINLLPPEATTWPKNFAPLCRYALDNDLAPWLHRDSSETTRHEAHRRQRRLAYAATVLLGGTARSTGLLNRGMRQKLLEVPSTKGRLWAVLECFEEFLQVQE